MRFSLTCFQIEFSYWIKTQRGRLEQLSFGFNWYTPWKAGQAGSGNFSTKLWRPIDIRSCTSPYVWVISMRSTYIYVMCGSLRVRLSVCCILQTCGQSFSVCHNCTKHIQLSGICSEAFLNPFTNILSMCTCSHRPLWFRVSFRMFQACGYSHSHRCTRYTLLPLIKNTQI